MTDLTASDENSEFVHAGVWQVTVHTEPVDAGKAMADVLRPEEAHLEAVRADMPTGTAIPAWLDEALSFTYPFEAATHTVAKLSVSEIKRRLAEATEEEKLIRRDRLGYVRKPRSHRPLPVRYFIRLCSFWTLPTSPRKIS